MHGRQLYDELVRVPLVMAGPAPFGGGRVVRGSVGLIDVMPTFLDLAGMPAIDGTQARSFLDLAVADGPGRPIVSEELVTPPKTAGAQNALVQSVRTERWKFIVTYDLLEGRVTEEAYDLERDPGEREDLAAGTGRVSTAPFDADFCDAIEEVRDRIWGAVDRTQSLVGSGYATGVARVTDERPPRTCLRLAAPPR
jgi:arylsulfatase A-like enzyme